MSKPSLNELMTNPRYTGFTVEVRAFSDNNTGNLYFVDDFDVVLDAYVQVVDAGGVPSVRQRRSGAKNLGSWLLRGAAAILANNIGIPNVAARQLLKLTESDQSKALAFKTAFSLAKEKQYREAAMEFVGGFGWVDTIDVLNAADRADGFMSYDDFMEKLNKKE